MAQWIVKRCGVMQEWCSILWQRSCFAFRKKIPTRPIKTIHVKFASKNFARLKTTYWFSLNLRLSDYIRCWPYVWYSATKSCTITVDCTRCGLVRPVRSGLSNPTKFYPTSLLGVLIGKRYQFSKSRPIRIYYGRHGRSKGGGSNPPILPRFETSGVFSQLLNFSVIQKTEIIFVSSELTIRPRQSSVEFGDPGQTSFTYYYLQ